MQDRRIGATCVAVMAHLAGGEIYDDGSRQCRVRIFKKTGIREKGYFWLIRMEFEEVGVGTDVKAPPKFRTNRPQDRRELLARLIPDIDGGGQAFAKRETNDGSAKGVDVHDQ